MKLPLFTPFEFLDANTLNAGVAAISGSLAALASGTFSPGLIRPDVVGYAASGLVLTVTAPLPFRTLFGSGVLADAHGTVTGTDTSSYAVNFAGVVPASGAAVTAYLLASAIQIQETPYQVVGPPAGHPDFNPNFVPVTAYQQNVDSIQLTASTTAPDNITTFELGRFTLASGATGLATINQSFQVLTQTPDNTNTVQVSGTGSIVASQAGRLISVTAPSVQTLPPLAKSNGLMFGFTISASGVVISGAAGDQIFGGYATGVSGVGSISPSQESTVYLLGIANQSPANWQVVGGSARGLGVPLFQDFAGNPNGNLAGNAGSPGIAAPDMVYDTTDNLLWVCTTTGTAATAVWTMPYRIKATAPITVYVSTTGSDANSGVDAAHPFATFNHAFSVLQSGYDFNGQQATIQPADGTYTNNPLVVTNNCAGQASPIILNGHAGSPGSVVLNCTSPGLTAISVNGSGAQLQILNLTISATGAGAVCIQAAFGASVNWNNIAFGAANIAHVQMFSGGSIARFSSSAMAYTIGGSAGAHISATGGSLANIAGATITLSGSPAFSNAFAIATDCGVIQAAAAVFGGTGATGPRYNVTANGVIDTGGGGANFFPGNSSGTTATGGQYV